MVRPVRSEAADHRVVAGLRRGGAARRSSGGRSFAAFYLKNGEIIALDAVNRPKEFMAAKRMIAERKRVAASRLADEAVTPAELMRG
ncbi:MAG: oxidoreductase C-terminal domain-containing protein [Hyphomicrobiaceae bacterium]